MYEELDWINSCLQDGTLICCWLGSRDYLYLYSLVPALNQLLLDVFTWLKRIHVGFRCQIVPQKIQGQSVYSIILNAPAPHYGKLPRKKRRLQDPYFMRYLTEKCPLWILYADKLLTLSQT